MLAVVDATGGSHMSSIRSAVFLSGSALIAAVMAAPTAAADRCAESDPPGDMAV